MSEAKNCPMCRLVNPPEAERCDCGYDFAARQFVGSLLPKARDGRGSAHLLGCLLVPAGILLGAVIGMPIWVWAASLGSEGCGLGVLPLMLEGFVGGVLLGGLAGAVATLLIEFGEGESNEPGSDTRAGGGLRDLFVVPGHRPRRHPGLSLPDSGPAPRSSPLRRPSSAPTAFVSNTATGWEMPMTSGIAIVWSVGGSVRTWWTRGRDRGGGVSRAGPRQRD